MIFAYRESTASLSARIVSADSPLIAPESTVEPGVFEIMYGSPVRYDSSITPWPSTTVPSTGQTSCGKTSTTSPTATSASGTSAIVESCLRWASDGIRLASASSTDDALRTAYASSASPPESISTTSVPARYSSRSTDVTIEMPASRSEPNSRRTELHQQLPHQRHAAQRQRDPQRHILHRRRRATCQTAAPDAPRSPRAPARRWQPACGG